MLRKRREGKGREGKGRDGKGREEKRREGKGREEKRREGKGRDGKGPRFEWARHCRLLLDGREASVEALTMGLCL